MELFGLIASYLDIRHLAERKIFLNILGRLSVIDKLSTIILSSKFSQKRRILTNIQMLISKPVGDVNLEFAEVLRR